MYYVLGSTVPDRPTVFSPLLSASCKLLCAVLHIKVLVFFKLANVRKVRVKMEESSHPNNFTIKLV